MTDTLTVLINLFILIFVLTSMFGTGLSLTVGQIIEPLRNTRAVLLALLANFVLVPALAYLLTAVLPLGDGLRTGLIIIACVAGAPFLPKLAGAAKGNIAFSVGLMILLMVLTVVYAPLVLPLLLPGVTVSPWAIAQPLITLMLIPLAVGLFVRAWKPDAAAGLAPYMNQASSYSLIAAATLGLLVGWRSLIGAFGTSAYLAAILFVVGAIAIGFLLGGREPTMRSVMALGTGQRNISAALLIATTSFTDPQVVLMVLVVSVVGLALLFLVAGVFGKQAAGEPVTQLDTGR